VPEQHGHDGHREDCGEAAGRGGGRAVRARRLGEVPSAPDSGRLDVRVDPEEIRRIDPSALVAASCNVGSSPHLRVLTPTPSIGSALDSPGSASSRAGGDTRLDGGENLGRQAEEPAIGGAVSRRPVAVELGLLRLGQHLEAEPEILLVGDAVHRIVVLYATPR
jgi:hypothetical protein